MSGPKILQFGKNGQIGRELTRALMPIDNVSAYGRTEADFQNPGQLTGLIDAMVPEIILNAAAYTFVDRAEGEREKAAAINQQAVGVIAKAAANHDAWFIHYSTDYVYDGEKASPYVETDQAAPLSVYGRTKLGGEQEIRTYLPQKHIILRTSWIYAEHGNNFVKTILRLAAEREELNIVADQFGAPTSAALVADITAKMVRTILERNDPDLSGIYHLTAAGAVSWYDFACAIVEWARAVGAVLKVKKINPISWRDYPVAARRPCNSQLDTSKLRQTYHIDLPDWHEDAKRTVEILVRPLS